MLSVTKETLKPPSAVVVVSEPSLSYRHISLTGINGSNRALNDNNRKTVQSCQESDNLLQCRELSYHVQEHGNERAETEEYTRNHSIALPRPFGQDETFWAFAPDNGAKCTKYQER